MEGYSVTQLRPYGRTYLYDADQQRRDDEAAPPHTPALQHRQHHKQREYPHRLCVCSPCEKSIEFHRRDSVLRSGAPIDSEL
jgi:hypothetical protein